MEALREEKQLRFCPWMHSQQEGRDFCSSWVFSNSWSEDESLREEMNSQNCG